MKKKLILFAGHLASGKTTISKRLADDLKLTCLNKDDIKEVLAKKIGFKNREENLKLSYATFDIMCYMIERAFIHDEIMILESNFKPHELTKIHEIATNLMIETYTLFLTADVNILYDRYIKRDQSRDEVHRSTGLLSFEIFQKVMDEYVFDIRIHDIKVDTSYFDDQAYDDLRKIIVRVIKEDNHDV